MSKHYILIVMLIMCNLKAYVYWASDEGIQQLLSIQNATKYLQKYDDNQSKLIKLAGFYDARSINSYFEYDEDLKQIMIRDRRSAEEAGGSRIFKTKIVQLTNTNIIALANLLIMAAQGKFDETRQPLILQSVRSDGAAEEDNDNTWITIDVRSDRYRGGSRYYYFVVNVSDVIKSDNRNFLQQNANDTEAQSFLETRYFKYRTVSGQVTGKLIGGAVVGTLGAFFGGAVFGIGGLVSDKENSGSIAYKGASTAIQASYETGKHGIQNGTDQLLAKLYNPSGFTREDNKAFYQLLKNEQALHTRTKDAGSYQSRETFTYNGKQFEVYETFIEKGLDSSIQAPEHHSDKGHSHNATQKPAHT